MFRNLIVVVCTFLLGFGISYFILAAKNNDFTINEWTNIIADNVVDKTITVTDNSQKEVIGFLPFWLLSNAKYDYSNYINNLSIFSIIVDKEGKIKKYDKPGEGEPGYFSIRNGKFEQNIKSAKENKTKLSLVVFSGKDEDIDSMLVDPKKSADNLTSDLIPIIEEYGFEEINLDIEKVSDASPSARLKFVDFVKNVRNITDREGLSLTLDVTASSFVKETNLVDPFAISQHVDRIIIMAYDFHYIGSFVTGPVAPQEGAGIVSEYDVETAVIEATRKIDSQKIILGIPLYGYEWETIGDSSRSAIIPSSGRTISNRRAEEFVKSCSNCKVEYDPIDKETNVIYKEDRTGLYHQIFYPEIESMRSKLKLVDKYNLGGIALWALGYEGETILEPLFEWSRQTR